MISSFDHIIETQPIPGNISTTPVVKDQIPPKYNNPRPGTRPKEIYICEFDSFQTCNERKFGEHMLASHDVNPVDNQSSQDKVLTEPQPRRPNLDEIFPDITAKCAAYEEEIKKLKEDQAKLRESIWDLKDELEDITSDRDKWRGNYDRLKKEIRKRRREEDGRL
ncbi:hypothetical protein ABW20_dc0107626 [Dactylellina cionopaga]|nr:hypothetical protein ABW20_dc0107626 [Dactylellina cionopaga]